MNIIQKKRGVSEVVSVVLIIMITVAAVAVLWTIVIPMVKDGFNKGSSCFNVQSDVTLVTDTGFTCINRSDGNISVQIKKGADSKVNLTGINLVIVLPDGNSASASVNGTMPGINAERTYVVGNVLWKNATEVKIAPVLKLGKTEQVCEATQSAVLTDC